MEQTIKISFSVAKIMVLILTLAACGSEGESTAADAEARWHPKPGLSWQWQLSGRVDTSFDVDVYDVDGVDTPASTVRGLHSGDARVVCYLSAGSWERWRPDAGDFPASVRGRDLDGWPGEKWLDIRRIGTLRPIMERRMDACRRKGFDAIEPDNIDGYANESGFQLTYRDQLAYNRMLAREGHERGMAIALKNDTDQVEDLVEHFDFAVVEECFAYKECGRYTPFVEAGKAVFLTEYDTGDMAAECEKARRQHFSLIFKRLELGAWRRAC